ncbi:unnamed protein product [Closterium sp. NIES-64]|nr:unnamed protein product [Closterium sp. NIES-64]
MAEPSKTAAGEPRRHQQVYPREHPLVFRQGAEPDGVSGEELQRRICSPDGVEAARVSDEATPPKRSAEEARFREPPGGTSPAARRNPRGRIGAPHVFPRMGRGDIRRAYTLGRELGKGGGGVVRECLEPIDGRARGGLQKRFQVKAPVPFPFLTSPGPPNSSAFPQFPNSFPQTPPISSDVSRFLAFPAADRTWWRSARGGGGEAAAGGARARGAPSRRVRGRPRRCTWSMELCTGGDLYDLLTAATTLPSRDSPRS